MDRFLVNFLLPDAYCYNPHSFSPRLSFLFLILYFSKELFTTQNMMF